MAERRRFDTVSTVDYHTAGEPFRIVSLPPIALPGATVGERRVRALENDEAQFLRRFLCFEPRGHADMYGGFITPPDDDGAHFGVLFWHKDGFSTACGHGTIALGAWAVESGLVPADPSGVTEVIVDVPSGRVTARVHSIAGSVVGVDFVNVASYVVARGLPVPTTRGAVLADVSYSGALYAQVDLASLGLSFETESLGELIALGREIKWALDATPVARHVTDERLNGIYGTILFESQATTEPGAIRQKNVTVFADGQVDRSPCGSGTGARLATLAQTGELAPGQILLHESIVGTVFRGSIDATDIVDGHSTVHPIVSGTAYRTGRHVFDLDERDDLVPGFVLR